MNGIKRYSVLIGDVDNFHGGCDELPEAYLNRDPAVHCIDFQVPAGLPADLVTLIARGLMWDSDWTAQGTVSTVLEDLTEYPNDDGPENYCAGT